MSITIVQPMKMLVICILTTFEWHMTSIAKHFLALFVGNKIDLPTVVYITLDISRREADNCECIDHFMAGGNGFQTLRGRKKAPPLMWIEQGGKYGSEIFFFLWPPRVVFFSKNTPPMKAISVNIVKRFPFAYTCLLMYYVGVKTIFSLFFSSYHSCHSFLTDFSSPLRRMGTSEDCPCAVDICQHGIRRKINWPNRKERGVQNCIKKVPPVNCCLDGRRAPQQQQRGLPKWLGTWVGGHWSNHTCPVIGQITHALSQVGRHKMSCQLWYVSTEVQ